MLDVRRMRVLREVAARGSFSAAADALSYTQSAISQQVAALEREAGTTLVDRSAARGIRLTDAGRGAGRALRRDPLPARGRRGRAGGDRRPARRPPASRGVPDGGGDARPAAVARFSEQHPGVELSFTEFEPEDALPRLKGRRRRHRAHLRLLHRRRPSCPGERARGACICSTTRCTSCSPRTIRSRARRPCASRTCRPRPGCGVPGHELRPHAPAGLPGRAASIPGSPSRATTTTSCRAWSPRASASR